MTLSEILNYWEVYHRQRRIQNPFKHLRSNFFKKKLIVFSCELFSQNAPSQISEWVPNRPVNRCGINSKSILEFFGKNGLLVKTIRRTGYRESWLQDTSVMVSLYGKKAALGQWRSRFFTFIGSSLNMLEVRDRKKDVSRM